jgi:uncharacterized membrane protein
MAQFSVRRTIAAPIEAVFALAADFANAPKHVSGIKRVEMLTDGPVRVGTRFRETRVMFGKEATEEMEVVALTPPHGYVLGSETCGCRYRCEIRLTPAANGTDVVMNFDAQPLTFFAKIMCKLMGFMMKSVSKACEQDLEDLKAAVESRRAAT